MLDDNTSKLLPTIADDNQLFLDSDGNVWQYDQQTDSWNSIGPSIVISEANQTSPGLLNPKFKLLLDTIAQFPGAFGIIVDKPIKQVVQGNVKLESNSLLISCLNSSGNQLDSTSGCNGETTVTCGPSSDTNKPETLPRLVVKLNPDYLEKLCIDLPSPKGKKGKKGLTGPDGTPGFGNGPKGLTGSTGPNVDQLLKLRNIIIQDDPTITNDVIVKLELIDRGRGPYLRGTKSKATLRDNECASRFVISQIGRNIQFNSELTDGCELRGLTNWSIVKVGNDTLPENVFLLRMSDSNDATCSTFAGVSLSEYITSLINKYEQDLVAIDQEWSLKVKAHIDAIDSQARNILSDLANDLAICESELPASEWSLIFEKCPSSSPQSQALKLTSEKGKVDSFEISGQQWDLIV